MEQEQHQRSPVWRREDVHALSLRLAHGSRTPPAGRYFIAQESVVHTLDPAAAALSSGVPEPALLSALELSLRSTLGASSSQFSCTGRVQVQLAHDCPR